MMMISTRTRSTPQVAFPGPSDHFRRRLAVSGSRSRIADRRPFPCTGCFDLAGRHEVGCLEHHRGHAATWIEPSGGTA